MPKSFKPPKFSVLDTQIPDYTDEMFVATSQVDWLAYIDGHSFALFKVYELPDMAAVKRVTSSVLQPFAKEVVLQGSEIKYELVSLTSQFATKKYDGAFYTVWLDMTMGVPISKDLGALTIAALNWYIDYLIRIDNLDPDDDAD